MLKLGVIDVLNMAPVYYNIINKMVPAPCRIVRGKVTELNKKLSLGEIDISVISSFEYAQNPELYYVFPRLSVGGDGPIHSIYLFLNKPLEELDNDAIKLTEFSLTSVHLIQYLLKDRRVCFISGGRADCRPAGELLIADDAIRRFYKKSDPFVYDLSSLWKKKTGLPFVFALWAVRRDVFEKFPEEVAAVGRALLNSKKKSYQTLALMAEERYRGIFPDRRKCLEYLENIHYDFSEKYQQGFQLFQKKLFKMGKLKSVAPLAFLPE